MSPMAYMVYCLPGEEYEYKVFANKDEAESYACDIDSQLPDSPEYEETKVIPLYAIDAIK